ncbi:MAG: ferredoxin [Acidobacteriales bacterium]|nr:ferredoxin [Terriglobales bacterium]
MSTPNNSDPDAQFTVTLLFPDNSQRNINVPVDEFILDAANDAGIVLPAICRHGRCLTCAGRIVNNGDSVCDFDQSHADAYFPADRAAGFILPCTAKPTCDLTIKTHQQDAMRTHRLAHGLPAPYA